MLKVSCRFEAASRVLAIELAIESPIVFAPRLRVALGNGKGEVASFESTAGPEHYWLPRGRYAYRFAVPPLGADAQAARVEAVVRHRLEDTVVTTCEVPVTIGAAAAANAQPWSLSSVAPAPALETLSWRKGDSDWFFRHFDHAAPTVVSYLLGDHPSLRGRILDIGCGDGITDLGIALRTGCEELVGVEPFRQYETLPKILAENGLPADLVPKSLRFVPEDANFLPFPDDHFDVVVSWGSVEHIAGGYLRALREVKRVLRHDGLFMVAPGLFYSNIGHHLGEFCDEPFFHLKKSPEDIRRMVLSTPPRYMDRAGLFASNEEYWQWYTELNRITVARFEQEMRALEFRPWRVALRTDALVEYTPEIEHYPLQDLANTELYSSWINCKPPRDAMPRPGRA